MTIVRRQHNSNFTVLPNKILNDERLKSENLGVLVYLLGRPQDWAVYIGQLADRFSCSKDRIYRIMHELIELGYVSRETIRGETSKFQTVEYVVYDEPPLRENPDTAFPGTVDPSLLKTDLDKELKDNNLCPNKRSDLPPATGTRVKAAYSDDFESFWQSYPDRTNNSKPKAFAEWRKLAEEDRAIAAASLAAFGDYCRKNRDYRVVHCERYLRDRRFDSWANPRANGRSGPKYFSV